MKALEPFGIIPIDSAVLENTLAHYKSPKDKIATLVKGGFLIRLKKGLFVVSPEVHRESLSKELIANHLYGPSYISLESALSFHGMIPERVQSTRSVTFKRAKQYVTPFGRFDYVTVPENYYTVGMGQILVGEDYAFLMAGPEKALCDMITATSGLRIQSVKSVSGYLNEDLRVDLSVKDQYDGEIIKECIRWGRKKTELTMLLKYLSQ